MGLEEWLGKPREVSANYHFLIGREWLAYGIEHELQAPLVYAAFEFRGAVERMAFELLLHFRGGNPSGEEVKRSRRFGELVALLRELEGDERTIYRKFKFLRPVCEVNGLPYSPAIVNLTVLERHWRVCSEFCHKQLSPGETWADADFVKKAYKRLKVIDAYLEKLLFKETLMWVDDFPQEVSDLRQDFIDGTVTESQVSLRLKLMHPVLTQRLIFRGLAGGRRINNTPSP